MGPLCVQMGESSSSFGSFGALGVLLARNGVKDAGRTAPNDLTAAGRGCAVVVMVLRVRWTREMMPPARGSARKVMLGDGEV